MKGKKILLLVTTLLTLLFAIGAVLVICVLHSVDVVNTETDLPAKPQGTVYYVDAMADSEDYDGSSEDKPLRTLGQVNALELQPGDIVLFKKDCRWVGELRIKDSGTKDRPIIFGMYGEGKKKPCIDGQGIAMAPVWGEDISFVEIRNLEVTNPGDDTRYHRGISIVAVQKDVEGIVIQNCYVHDVSSRTNRIDTKKVNSGYMEEHWYGGIIVRAGSNATPEETKVVLKNVLIDGNKVDNCSLLGIMVGTTMVDYQSDAKSQNTIIRGNTVSNCYGDGIVLANDNNGLIEHNVSANNGTSGDLQAYYAGIWNIFCTNTIFQYNEAYGQGPSGDGQGFDIDGACSGTIFQYNYSHDNYSGMLLCMHTYCSDAIVRYNVSVNDGENFLEFGYTINEAPYVQLEVYNNVFYTTKKVRAAIDFDVHVPVVPRVYGNFRNNIFYVNNGEKATLLPSEQWEYIGFSNNCYYGFDETTLPKNEKGQIIGDPKFVFPGSGGVGLQTLEGYQLLASSPCLETGISVHNDGGLDFYGNQIQDNKSTNIGIYAGAAVTRPAGVNLASGQQVNVSSVKGDEIMKNQTMVRLVDGKTDKAVATKPANTETAEEWFEITLNDVYEISKVVLSPMEGGKAFPKDFTITICDEDGKWVEVFAKKNCKQPESGEKQTYSFDTVKTNKVRVNVTKLREADRSYYAALAEFEVY